jgi:hypothetical protein
MSKKLQTKLQFIFMRLKTTNDSHIKLKMKIHKQVCTLRIYWKLNKNITKSMFYGSATKIASQICGIPTQKYAASL